VSLALSVSLILELVAHLDQVADSDLAVAVDVAYHAVEQRVVALLVAGSNDIDQVNLAADSYVSLQGSTDDYAADLGSRTERRHGRADSARAARAV